MTTTRNSGSAPVQGKLWGARARDFTTVEPKIMALYESVLDNVEIRDASEYWGELAIKVEDQEKTAEFYKKTFGMTESRFWWSWRVLPPRPSGYLWLVFYRFRSSKL
jgi:hypothetical protein